LAPYQLSDIHITAEIQEFGAIGEGYGFELTRLRLAIKSYAIVKHNNTRLVARVESKPAALAQALLGFGLELVLKS
jgi:hypothetical protein